VGFVQDCEVPELSELFEVYFSRTFVKPGSIYERHSRTKLLDLY